MGDPIAPTLAEWHAQIEAAPDDLDLRTVFADWLKQQGDPMGDYLGLECQIAASPDHPDRRKWRRAANALFRANSAAWDLRGQTTWRGGLLEEAEVASYADLDALAQRAPALRKLTLRATSGRPADPAFEQHPVWRRVRVLEWTDGLGDLVRLLDAGALPQLHEIVVSYSDNAQALFERIGAGRAPSLTALTANNRSEKELAAFAKATHSLTSLGLYEGALTEASAAALAEGALLDGIETLWIGRTSLTTAGLGALTSSGRLASLARLDLRNNRLREPRTWLPALLAAAPRLASLELMGSRLERDVSLLATTDDPAPSLTELSLHGCRAGDAATIALLQHPLGQRLRALNLRGNQLTDATANAIAALPPGSLVVANFENNGFTRAGLSKLENAPFLARATVSAGRLGSQLYTKMTNEKHGVWLGSTYYKASSVLRKPA